MAQYPLHVCPTDCDIQYSRVHILKTDLWCAGCAIVCCSTVMYDQFSLTEYGHAAYWLST